MEFGNLKIVILGPDGAGKSSVIQGLMANMNWMGRVATVRHLKPFFIVPRRYKGGINVDPHGKQPRSSLSSLIKIFIWLIEEWCANLLQDKRSALLICDRYYHDLLVDPKRYRYGGPLWAARLVGNLIPQPTLWVLLDAPAEVLQERKQEVPLEETVRQRHAYLAFVRDQRKHVTIDASQSLDKVIADVEYAIIGSICECKGNRG
jgi:thymidylate kinase